MKEYKYETVNMLAVDCNSNTECKEHGRHFLYEINLLKRPPPYYNKSESGSAELKDVRRCRVVTSEPLKSYSSPECCSLPAVL
jgi:hypothetical protein